MAGISCNGIDASALAGSVQLRGGSSCRACNAPTQPTISSRAATPRQSWNMPISLNQTSPIIINVRVGYNPVKLK